MVLGIIAEYNPFHNGHLYHLLKSKELTKDDYCIAIISGNFTQRGEASLVDKWAKTEMALANGVDLVLELPTLYATSSAENFAEGAIKILTSLKIVDHLSFGAETDNLSKLNIIANTLYKEPKEYKNILSDELNKGISFPKSMENALVKFSNDNSYSIILNEPNNILVIEYLKALKKYKSTITPVLIPRKKAGHLNYEYTGQITSASAIRNMIQLNRTKNLKNTLTPSSYTILADEMKKGHYVANFSIFEKTITYKLRTMSLEDIRKLPDVSEGLENIIKKAAFSCNNIQEFINIASSKRYTETRLQRILLYSLLGFTKKDIQISKKTIPYARVLGFNNNGKKLISQISKSNPNLEIVTSVKKFMDSNKNRNLQTMMEKDIYATNIYTLGFDNDSWGNLDFTTKIVIKD